MTTPTTVYYYPATTPTTAFYCRLPTAHFYLLPTTTCYLLPTTLYLLPPPAPAADYYGYCLRGAAGGGDYVDHGDLALAAELAKMAVPPSLYSPRQVPLGVGVGVGVRVRAPPSTRRGRCP